MENPQHSEPPQPGSLSQTQLNKEEFYCENAALFEKLRTTHKQHLLPRKEPVTNESDVVVGVRIRPLSEKDKAEGLPCAIFPREGCNNIVDVHDLHERPTGRFWLKTASYQVDRTFNATATTADIYNDLVADLVHYALGGFVGTFFTFGQTGSGKTFTFSEIQELVAETLLGEKAQEAAKARRARNIEMMIYMSNIELAPRNRAYDLYNSRKPVKLLQNEAGETKWVGASQKLVGNKDEMMDLINHAAALRRTSPTYKNDASSRAHSVCQIRIVDPVLKSEGVLYLADLAGFEVARDRAAHTAQQMQDTCEINKSMMVLKECIRLRAEFELKSKLNGLVPFRQSTLTKVLKHVLDPRECRPCKTVILTCVDPNIADGNPSRNTLKWAEKLHAAVSVSKPGPSRN